MRKCPKLLQAIRCQADLADIKYHNFQDRKMAVKTEKLIYEFEAFSSLNNHFFGNG